MQTFGDYMSKALSADLYAMPCLGAWGRMPPSLRPLERVTPNEQWYTGRAYAIVRNGAAEALIGTSFCVPRYTQPMYELCGISDAEVSRVGTLPTVANGKHLRLSEAMRYVFAANIHTVSYDPSEIRLVSRVLAAQRLSVIWHMSGKSDPTFFTSMESNLSWQTAELLEDEVIGYLAWVSVERSGWGDALYLQSREPFSHASDSISSSDKLSRISEALHQSSDLHDVWRAMYPSIAERINYWDTTDLLRRVLAKQVIDDMLIALGLAGSVAGHVPRRKRKFAKIKKLKDVPAKARKTRVVV